MEVEQNQKEIGLLISTMDPRSLGGVTTSYEAFIKVFSKIPEFNKALAYSSTQAGDPANVTLNSFCRGVFSPQIIKEEINKIPSFKVGYYFPKIEFQRHRTNFKLWQPLLKKFPIHQVISGVAYDAFPHALAGVKFVLWIGTDIESERATHLKSYSWGKRLLVSIQTPELLKMEEFVLQRASWVFAISEASRNRLIARGCPKEKISVLSFPIETTSLSFSEDRIEPPTIVWAGRLNDSRKNTPFLIQAFRTVLNKIPTAKLKLVGPQTNSSLQQLCQQLGVLNSVEFLGELPYERVLEVFQRATVFAIPSLQEGLCIAGIEAMAAGLPVISTRCQGPESYVIQEKTGYLVNSELEMAQRLIEVLSNRSMWETMQSHCLSYIKQECSPHKFLENILTCYAEVWPEYRSEFFKSFT